MNAPIGYEIISQSLWAKEANNIKNWHPGRVEEFLSFVNDEKLRLFYGLKRINKETEAK